MTMSTEPCFHIMDLGGMRSTENVQETIALSHMLEPFRPANKTLRIILSLPHPLLFSYYKNNKQAHRIAL